MPSTVKNNPKNDSPEVHLNIDAIPRPDEVEPFIATLGGKRITFTHAEDLDAFEFMRAFMGGEAEATYSLLQLALDENSFKLLRSAGLKTWQLNGIVNDYLVHCGLRQGE